MKFFYNLGAWPQASTFKVNGHTSAANYSLLFFFPNGMAVVPCVRKAQDREVDWLFWV